MSHKTATSLFDSAPLSSSRVTKGVGERWILGLCVVLLLWNPGYSAFTNPDEGRYAAASLEMAGLVKGSPPDWIVPHLNTIPRLNKPPLLYWMTATSFRVFGASEWAGRLVPALCSVATLLIIWALGRSMFGRRAAILASVVWATSLLPFVTARLLTTDMLLCAAMTLGLCGIWRTLEDVPSSSDAPHEYSWTGPLMAGVGLGLALLAKGPVGVALPLLITFVYLCAARRWHRVPWGRVAFALVVALAIGVPWYLAVTAREPDFPRRFFLQENLNRFSGKTEYHGKKPVYYYAPYVLAGMLPWTPFLFFAAPRSKKQQTLPRRDETQTQSTSDLEDCDDGARARLFLWLWAGLTVAFFSASGTKLAFYILPAFPALALLCGEAMHFLWRGRASPGMSLAAPRIFLGFTLLMNAVVAFAMFKLLSNDKVLPRRDGMPLAWLYAFILLAGSLLSLWAWQGASRAGSDDRSVEGFQSQGFQSRRWLRLIGVQAGTMAILYASLLVLAQRFVVYEDSGAMMRAFAPYLKPDDRFVEFQLSPQYTPIFHLARPVEFVDFQNNSGLAKADLTRSPLFLNSQTTTIPVLLAGPRRTFVLVSRKEGNVALPPNAYLVARNSDFQLISNRPAPAGFAFDNVASDNVAQ